MKSNLLELGRIGSNACCGMRMGGLGRVDRKGGPVGGGCDDIAHALEPEGGAGGARESGKRGGLGGSNCAIII